MERVGGEKLETSALGLMFRIKPKYVKLGLKLECTASIGSVYWQSFLETPKVSPKEQIAISGNWWTSSDANRELKANFSKNSVRKSQHHALKSLLDLSKKHRKFPKTVSIISNF